MLAKSLMEKRGISREELSRLHPGGMIGKRLLLKVSDIMRTGNKNPVVKETAPVREVLSVMTSTKMGAASVINKKGKITGYFTDGDLRRKIRAGMDLLDKPITAVMTGNPVTLNIDDPAVKAARLIKEKNFDNIPVIDSKRRPVGIVDERDLLAHGLLEED